MLKHLTSLALTGAIVLSMSGCIIVTGDDSDTAGDGDGDDTETSAGDGDGDAGDGDGDAGDGDGDAGDGDGDPAATDTETTDTDTTDTDTTDTDTTDTEGTDTEDPTDPPAGMCGWNGEAGYYDCGFEGEDPGGENAIGCPDGLVEGDPCETTGITDIGCCDADGNNWYCTSQGEVVVFVACEG